MFNSSNGSVFLLRQFIYVNLVSIIIITTYSSLSRWGRCRSGGAAKWRWSSQWEGRRGGHWAGQGGWFQTASGALWSGLWDLSLHREHGQLGAPPLPPPTSQWPLSRLCHGDPALWKVCESLLAQSVSSSSMKMSGQVDYVSDFCLFVYCFRPSLFVYCCTNHLERTLISSIWLSLSY